MIKNVASHFQMNRTNCTSNLPDRHLQTLDDLGNLGPQRDRLRRHKLQLLGRRGVPTHAAHGHIRGASAVLAHLRDLTQQPLEAHDVVIHRRELEDRAEFNRHADVGRVATVDGRL